MDVQSSPLAVLSLIVAPAVLTNASSVLGMSTTNRFARASDRARELARQLEDTSDPASPQAARRLSELATAERRSLMLLAALRSIYLALGSFAFATLSALVGAVLVSMNVGILARTIEGIGLGAGLLALAALVHGSIMLVRETRIVVGVLQERAAGIRARIAGRHDRSI